MLSPEEIKFQKNTLRHHFQHQRRSLSHPTKKSASTIITTTLKQWPRIQNATSIACFYPTPMEPNIIPFYKSAIAAGKTLYFPRYDTQKKTYIWQIEHNLSTGFHSGPNKCMQPTQLTPSSNMIDIHLALVPGVGFDTTGTRLGHGHGIFDQLLQFIRGITIGIGFYPQLTHTPIPTNVWDIKMDYLITESVTLSLSKQPF